MKTSRPIIKCLLLPFFFLHLGGDPADQFQEAMWITNGSLPAIAIDSQRRVHMVYNHGRALVYRQGDLEGNFGPQETVFSFVGLWDPRIAIDEYDEPHVVAADGHYHNRFIYYANRKGGSWNPPNPREPLVVFDRVRDELNRATTPSLFVVDGRAYVGAFTVGGVGINLHRSGAIAAIENLDSEPILAKMTQIFAWNPQVIIVDGKLWVGGADYNVGNRNFFLREHDLSSLLEIGLPTSGYNVSEGHSGEMVRSNLDQYGDILSAGTTISTSAFGSGWFQSQSRTLQGLPPIRYRTSLNNPNGAGFPVRDLQAKDRIYVFHWSDFSTGTFEPGPFAPPECPAGIQLRFVRIENGQKVAEMQSVTARTAAHGPTYRKTPAAAPHPDGGTVVVFGECGGGIYFNLIGVQRNRPFKGIKSLDNWKRTWFGAVHESRESWIYSEHHQWQWLEGEDSSLWLYDPMIRAWIWTNKNYFPHLYIVMATSPGAWYRFDASTRAPNRRFFSISDQQFVDESILTPDPELHLACEINL